VQGPEVLKNLDGLEASPSNQLVVRPTLQTTRDDNIFAIGDCAACVWQEKPGSFCSAACAGSAPAGEASRQADPAAS